MSKCKFVPNIQTLNTITEPSGRSTKISRNRIIHLNNLLTVLLDTHFNQGEAARIIDGLKNLRCPVPMIQTRLLSVLSFHEAMEQTDWHKCRGEWISACKRLEINEFSIGQAISVGQGIRANLYEKNKGRKKFKEATRKEVQKIFFGSKRVIKILG